MAKFDSDTIARWTVMAADYLGRNGYDLSDVKLGSEAWAIAHRSGISYEAYEDMSVVDAHIVTALKQIFPNAEFKDKYSY
jgi:hypothetical protein